MKYIGRYNNFFLNETYFRIGGVCKIHANTRGEPQGIEPPAGPGLEVNVEEKIQGFRGQAQLIRLFLKRTLPADNKNL